jgi:hypothetical protein
MSASSFLEVVDMILGEAQNIGVVVSCACFSASSYVFYMPLFRIRVLPIAFPGRGIAGD